MARGIVNRLYEKDLAFVEPESAPITASGELGEIALDKLVNAREGDHRNRLGAQMYEIIIVVSELATGGGDETYSFDIDTGPAGATDTTIATLNVSGPGQFIVALDSRTIEQLDDVHEAIALKATVGGVAPSASITAWLYGH